MNIGLPGRSGHPTVLYIFIMLLSPHVQSRVDDAAQLPVGAWHELHTKLIWAYQSEAPPYASGPQRLTMHYACWCIVKGTVDLTWDGGAVQVGAGHWVQPSPDTGRTQQFSPGAELLSLRFEAEWPGGRPLFPHRQPLVWPTDRFSGLTLAAERLRERVSQCVQNPTGRLAGVRMTLDDHMAVTRAFADWCEEWTSAMQSLGVQAMVPGRIDYRVSAARDLLDRQFYVPAVPYDAISNVCGISRVHLDRLFNRDLGMSPKHYVDRRCLSQAMSLLRGTRLTIKEVTYRLGFPAPAHFCRWFLRHTGSYPKAFRERMGEA